MAEPNLEKVRRDREEPICTKSKTAKDDPNFDTPKTANDDPTRAKLLNDKAEAILT
jgi:hypothetical protein